MTLRHLLPHTRQFSRRFLHLAALAVAVMWLQTGARAQGPASPAPAKPAPSRPAASPAPARPAPARPVPGAPAPAAMPAAAPEPADAAQMTDEQKTVYAIGIMVQRSLKPFDLSAEELALALRALSETAAGRPAIDIKEWGPKVELLAEERRGRVVAREKTAAIAYLDAAAAEAGAVRTMSGLVYRDLVAGAGASPTSRDAVRVHYRGTLTDGTVFDSSYERSEPVAFRLNEVVPCWTEGVQMMKVGGKARFVCPSVLAYGDEGSPGIPGGAALVFEVDLLGIIGPPAARD